jgi:hypothetical protein
VKLISLWGEVGDEVPSRPPPPTPLKKYFHDYSGINDVKPKVSFNLGRETPDMAGNVSPSCPSAESILMSESLDDLVDAHDTTERYVLYTGQLLVCSLYTGQLLVCSLYTGQLLVCNLYTGQS